MMRKWFLILSISLNFDVALLLITRAMTPHLVHLTEKVVTLDGTYKYESDNLRYAKIIKENTNSLVTGTV